MANEQAIRMPGKCQYSAHAVFDQIKLQVADCPKMIDLMELSMTLCTATHPVRYGNGWDLQIYGSYSIRIE